MALTKKQEEMFKEALGEDEFTKLVQAAEEKTADLEAAGIAHKALDAKKVCKRLRAVAGKADDDVKAAIMEIVDEMEGEEEEEKPVEEKQVSTPEIDLEALAAQIAKQLDVDVSPLTEQMEKQAAEIAELKKALVTKAKAREAETPRYVMTLEKRASEAAETALDPEASEADKALLARKPVETKAPEGTGAANFFPGKK